MHGEKERGGVRRERVELPDSLMYEAVLQSFTFTFNHLADAFIQSDVQMRRTIEAIRPSREQQYTSAMKSLS